MHIRGKLAVPRPVYEERLAICKDCKHFNDVLVNICKKCGCIIRFKLHLPGESCPIRKWPAYRPQ